jgi:hypothetical protein
LVISHGTEAHLLADLLVDRGIPVLCGPLFGTRTKLELAGRTLRSPAFWPGPGCTCPDHRSLNPIRAG